MRTEERKLLDLLGNTLDHIYTKFQNSQENELNYKMIRGMFLHLITTHKLENKIDKIFTCSLNNYHIDSKELYTELENKKKKVRLIFDEQCKVLRKIASQFRLRGFKELPIVIKGGSIFGITNDHRSIKRSNDIDLIYSDVSIIEMILTEMGFERKGDDKLSEHEYCMMVKDNVVIDVHKYIPIINYSDGIIDKSKKAVANNSRIFFESFTKIKQEKLLYSEIANNSLLSDFFGLPIPRLNYQVLILSANIFRDYVNSCFHFL